MAASSSTTSSILPEENLALNRFVVASSEASPDHAAARAVDGLFVTRWSPSLQDVDPWVSVDLGAVHALSHVVVFWGEFYPSSYLIQGKVTEWTTLAVVLGASDLLRSNLPQPTYARWVRVVSQSTGTDVRLWEFQVFADADVTVPTSSSATSSTALVTSTTEALTTTAADVLSTTTLAASTTASVESTAPVTTSSFESTSTPFYGPNLALTKPVLASSFRSPTEHAFRAVDGDLETQWASASMENQWLWVDLLGIYEVSQVVVFWGEEYSQFTLEIAPDGVQWTDVVTVNGSPGVVSTVFNPPILTQWVRVQCQTACSIRSFQVHGEAPAAATSSSTPLSTSTTSQSASAATSQSSAAATSQSSAAGSTSVSSSTQSFSKPNLALKRPVLSSSQRLPSEHVSAMVDGFEDSQWASATTDVMPWAWVDLLAVYHLEEVVVRWGVDYATLYDVQISDTGVNWVSVTTDYGLSDQTVRTTLPLGTQGKFLRIVCLSVSGSSCSIKELYVHEADAAPVTTVSPGTENLAKGKPVLASSQVLPHNHAPMAVDELASTQWESVSSPDQWIWIDLLGKYHLDHVIVSWGNSQPSTYNLEISDNAVNWDVAVADIQAGATVRTDFPAGTTTQWLRVFCKSANGCSIQEIEVYGSPTSVRRLRQLGPSMANLAYMASGCGLAALLSAALIAVRRQLSRTESERSDDAELEACMA